MGGAPGARAAPGAGRHRRPGAGQLRLSHPAACGRLGRPQVGVCAWFGARKLGCNALLLLYQILQSCATGVSVIQANLSCVVLIRPKFGHKKLDG